MAQVFTKSKIKSGDTVRVLRGKDRGKTGKVVAVLPQDNRVVVDGLNMVNRHVKAQRTGQKGQRVAVSAPLPLSNVQLVCPQCKKGTRVGITREDGHMTRVCKQCQAVISA